MTTLGNPIHCQRETYNMNRATLVAIAIGMFSHSAYALDANVERALTTDAKSVWRTIGAFCSIADWHPAVEKCVLSEKDGKTFRELTLGGGGTILEQLQTFDAASMSYTYTIVKSPLPVENYRSTISVSPRTSGSTLSWTGTFDAKGTPDADAVKTITGIYEAGTEALAKAK